MTTLSRACCLTATLLFATSCDGPPSQPDSPPSNQTASANPTPLAPTPAPTPSVASATPPTPSASANVAAAPAVPPEGPPVCKKANEKVQAEDAYLVTGLTTKKFKDELGIGFGAAGAKVLVVDSKGGTKVLDVADGDKTRWSNKDPSMWRNLVRVSPRDISGKTARAFVDYADQAFDKTDKKRHVWCGPADANETFLEWSGTSWLDLDPKPTGEDKKKLFSWKKLGGYVELRDCRTFVTLEGDKPWALGSVLRGMEKPDGTNEWKMVLVVDYGKNDDEVVLNEQPLKGDPPALATFEIPTMRRIGDKGFLVAARIGAGLWVATLDKDRKPTGTPQIYAGWPTSPAIGATKDTMYLVSGMNTGKEKSLKGAAVSREKPELPPKLTDIALTAMDATGDAETQFFGPELGTDAKGGLWLLYIEGAREKGHLRIVPVGPDMQPMGRSFPITSGDTYVSEARLVPREDGGFTVAYLRTVGKKTDLVTEDVNCEVQL
jgi:hypothetical protein